MRKVFLSLALVAIIVSSTMLPEIRQKTTASFAQVQLLFIIWILYLSARSKLLPKKAVTPSRMSCPSLLNDV